MCHWTDSHFRPEGQKHYPIWQRFQSLPYHDTCFGWPIDGWCLEPTLCHWEQDHPCSVTQCDILIILEAELGLFPVQDVPVLQWIEQCSAGLACGEFTDTNIYSLIQATIFCVEDSSSCWPEGTFQAWYQGRDQEGPFQSLGPPNVARIMYPTSVVLSLFHFVDILTFKRNW